jgi:GAF domain-containing protein
MVGEQVLGVVGLQDFRLDASFSDYQEKVTVALASQMAVALDNLRLIEDTQRALAELDAANYLLTGQAWERYTSRGGTVYGEWRGGEWVRLNEEAGAQKAENDPQRQTSNVQLPTSTRSIQLPIKVRGQVIGEFALQPVGDDSDWSPEEIAFGQSLVDQVGQMIETARLLEETERLAGRERTINTINSRVRQSVNMDTILKTAVGELGRSLGAARVFVQLSAPNEDPSAAGAGLVDPQVTTQAIPAPTTPAGNGKGGDHA